MRILIAALVAAERMRAAVEALAIPHPGRSPGVVTMSGGVAVYEHSDDLASLLARADDALYEAKGAGRNLVAVSPKPTERPISSAGP